MLKHNKKRNSAIVYEILVLEMTKSIMSGNEERKNKVLSLIKESFSKTSEMKKELDLYKQMQDLNNLKEEQINLPQHIKMVGEYEVGLELHPEVKSNVRVIISSSAK